MNLLNCFLFCGLCPLCSFSLITTAAIFSTHYVLVICNLHVSTHYNSQTLRGESYHPRSINEETEGQRSELPKMTQPAVEQGFKLTSKPVSLSLFFSYFFFFKREKREGAQAGGGAEREGESQAGSMPTVELNAGLYIRTLS